MKEISPEIINNRLENLLAVHRVYSLYLNLKSAYNEESHSTKGLLLASAALNALDMATSYYCSAETRENLELNDTFEFLDLTSMLIYIKLHRHSIDYAMDNAFRPVALFFQSVKAKAQRLGDMVIDRVNELQNFRLHNFHH